MFFPSGGRGVEVKAVYDNKDLFDRLKDMEVVAARNQNDATTKRELIPADVSELFFEGDKLVWRHLDEHSLGYFDLDNRIRQVCVYAMLNKWFDRIIFLSICANAFVLAADNPLNNEHDGMFMIMEIFFNVIFLVEFIIKIVCLGGWGAKSGYFRESWNRLDFTVLVFGWLPVFLSAFGVDGVNNFSFVRVIRILKVLKTINTIPGLKRLVQAVLDAIPQLISVANLLTIIFFLFGILGTQLFQGTLRRRCFPEDAAAEYIPEDALCSSHGRMGSAKCPVETPVCSEYNPTSHHANPNDNVYSNFDNTPVSFLTIFVVISLEGWSSVMLNVMETSGYGACLYFVILVIIGAYFVINLVIAVIYQSYIETIDELESHDMSFRLLVKMEMEEGFSGRQEAKAQSQTQPSSASGSGNPALKRLPSHGPGDSAPSAPAAVVLRRQTSGEVTRELRRQLTSDGGPPVKFMRQATMTRQLSRQASRAGPLQRSYSRQYSRQLPRDNSGGAGPISRMHAKKHPKTISKRLYRKGLLPVSVHRFLTVDANYLAFKKYCQDIVSRQAFDLIVVLVILFNIAVLSIQANGTTESNENFIEISNIIFTVFFCVELVMQMVALEIVPYLQSGYHMLDLVIVLLSIVELFDRGGSSSLSVFRTLRVFRTFKLFKRWESLQELIRAIVVSGEGLGYFCIVLLLFLFVFALTGRSLFAGQLPPDSRANFDSLFMSFVTTFQLVTGENWNEVLYQTMEFNPGLGATFCILVYALGTLVVLNIFLAILLETFSNEKNNTDSYYDKLDTQSSFQSSVKAAWTHAVSRVRLFVAYLRKRRREREQEQEQEGDDEERRSSSTKDRGSIFYSTKATAQRGSFKRVSLASTSKWIGWSDLDHGDSTKGEEFLDDDVWCRRVLSTISVGQVRRGGKMYCDSFTAAEVIDCLLDHEIVENLPLAVIMGQELVFQKKLIPVFIESHDDFDDGNDSDVLQRDHSVSRIVPLMSPMKKDLEQINREYATMISCSTITSSNTDGHDQREEVGRSASPSRGSRHVGFFNRNSNDHVSMTSLGSDDSVDIMQSLGTTVDDEREEVCEVNGGLPAEQSAAKKHVEFFVSEVRASIAHDPTTSADDEKCTVTSNLKQPKIRESSPSLRKLTSTMDTHFMDDKSLYRLNLQGEQVTEWLMNSKNSDKELKALKLQKREMEKKSILVGYSFGVFGPENPLRVFCTSVITHKHFEYSVLLVIVASSICLAVDEPGVDNHSSKARALKVTDYIFTIFFVLEMLVKMIAKGVFVGKKCYFVSGWNILDFVIVIISVISLALVSLDLSYLKAFRALRSLRPLRMVSRSPALKAVVNAIIMVTTPLANFTLVICVFLFTFAILGTTLFRDKLVYCKASTLNSGVVINRDEFNFVFNKAECVGNTTNADGVLVGLSWDSRNSNFDSVSRSLLTLFELITMEAWPSIMHPAMDIPSHSDEHPVENNSKYNALFFITFIVVGAFFITNLFVGIIVHKFRSARDKHHRSALLTFAQQKWLDDIQVAMTAKPMRHATLPDEDALFGLKRPIHLLVIDEKFMFGMDMLIIVNILVMSLEHFNQGVAIATFITTTNEVFTAIFTLEIVLRFLAVTPREFIAGKWNRLDSLIVLLALIDAAGGVITVNVTIFRVFRVARLFRLIKDSKNLIILIKTLYFSLPSLINVGTLLFLSFFVFAVVGMNLFGEAKRDGSLFNEYANFEGFPSSMLLLFQCMTGEDWNSVMYILKNQGYAVAVPFFALFLLTNKYMLLNLFIAIILENFEAALQADPEKVAQRNLEEFIREWSNIRKEIGSHDDDCMPSYCLVKILHSLEPPLGIRGTREANLALRTTEDRQRYRRYLLSLIRSLDLKEDSTGRVFFVDVVSALVRRGHANELGENVSVVENMSVEQRHELLSQLRHLTRKKRMTKLEMKMKDKIFTEIDLTVEVNSAMHIQAIWRGNANRKRLQEEALCGLLAVNDGAPRIVLNKSDSKKLRSFLKQDSTNSGTGTGSDSAKASAAMRILKLGSNSFNFVQMQAVVASDDEECSGCSKNEASDSLDSSSSSCCSSEDDIPGRFFQPRVPPPPLELETECQAGHLGAGDGMSPRSNGHSLVDRAKSVSRDFRNSVLQPLSAFLGRSAPSPSVGRNRSRSSSGLEEIASSGDDFNYFTLFEGEDRCMVLTHVNSQRHLMDNLFESQEKKKQMLIRRQSNKALNSPQQVDVDTKEFTDLDVYVMRPKVEQPPSKATEEEEEEEEEEEGGDFHL